MFQNCKKILLLLICLVFVQLYNKWKFSSNQVIKDRYRDRNVILQEVCHKYHQRVEHDYRIHRQRGTIFKGVKRSIRYNKENVPFIWCLVPKVGSTSWIELFVKVRFPKSYPTENQGASHRIIKNAWEAREKEVEFWVKASRHKFSFLISRHPFERILSAYRDKFFADNTSYSIKTAATYNSKYGKQIIKKYRKAIPSDEKYHDVPTFREFVEYLLQKPVVNMNAHWMPIYNLCMPCHINYSIIGRKESGKSDSEVILKRIGIEEELPESHVTKGGKSSDNTLKKYYSELDRKMLLRLYKLYELDFLLFDYTIDSYYEYV